MNSGDVVRLFVGDTGDNSERVTRFNVIPAGEFLVFYDTALIFSAFAFYPQWRVADKTQNIKFEILICRQHDADITVQFHVYTALISVIVQNFANSGVNKYFHPVSCNEIDDSSVILNTGNYGLKRII